MQTIVKDYKPTIRAWAMFDWSNSVYNLVITSTIFPAYYTAITLTEAYGDVVHFFGIPVVNTALSNFALGSAYLLMAILLPMLSSVADYRKNRMFFMRFFTYLGGLACMGLFFFKLETLEWGIFCFALAAVGYIGGLLFNNSYLPLIASSDRQDRVSALGFAYGYVGCVTLQIICFVIILKPEWFGISDPNLPARISFLLVGLWWIGFAQIPFKKLPQDPKPGQGQSSQPRINGAILKKGFAELGSVARKVRQMPTIRRFLPAYFFYSIGVQTLMVVAAAFGEKILQLGPTKLIGTILLIQLVAILGAWLMARLAEVIGNVWVLILVVCIWLGICVSAYFLSTEVQFYILAALVGLVMGGIQSISRSTFSKMIPDHEPNTASFFSFYEVTEKVAIVCGLFSFAAIEQLTGNIRNSALSLALFFLVGLFFLFRMWWKERGQRLSNQ
ncbi:MAG TPA: MFS transporter [Sphingobacteriaceae bacterium]|nr:MFS transporter [Sphingobacteriaceae bacterium]